MNLFNLFRRRTATSQPTVADHAPTTPAQNMTILHFPESLTSHIDDHQVLYLNAVGDTAIDNFVNNHYDDITRRFADAGLQFVDPRRQQPDPDEAVAYHRPDLAPEQWQHLVPPGAGGLAAIIRDSCLDPLPDRPLLLRYKHHLTLDELFTAQIHHRPPRVLFSAVTLSATDDDELLNLILSYPDNVGDDKIVVRYMAVKPKSPKDNADFDFNVHRLSKEIQQRIEQLRHLGIGEAFILSLLAPPRQPSPLVITPDFKLLLPEYDNMEIHLAPMSKALYFLFLRHPEGILLKHLCDHRTELADLYMLLSNRENLDKMNQSINDLVDSTKNSVNEKCSRIKEAFLLQFEESVARQYYITGSASDPKGILLPRHLVQDLSGLILPHPKK